MGTKAKLLQVQGAAYPRNSECGSGHIQPPSHETLARDATECLTVNALTTDFPLGFTDIAQYQQHDPVLNQIINQLKNGNSTKKYVLSKDVLCRSLPNGKSLRIVVPTALKPMLMEYYHASAVGAHMGIAKTIHHIRREYHWDGMSGEIAKFVRACRLCSLSNPARDTHVGKPNFRYS